MFLAIISPISYSWNKWNVRHFCFHNQNNSTSSPGLLSHSYLKIFFTSFGKKNWILVWNIKSYEIWGDISKRFRLVTALFCLLLHKFKCPCNTRSRFKTILFFRRKVTVKQSIQRFYRWNDRISRQIHTTWSFCTFFLAFHKIKWDIGWLKYKGARKHWTGRERNFEKLTKNFEYLI